MQTVIRNIDTKQLMYLVLIMVLIAIAAFRPVGFDRDSQIYYQEIMSYVMGERNLSLLEREPAYIFFLYVFKSFGNCTPRIIFFIYATISVIILVIAIKKNAEYPFVSTFLYVCLFFPILNMTQMRAAVAAALYLHSLQDIHDKNCINFYIKITVASLFHYSALIVVPFYLVNNTLNTKQKYFYLFLPIIGIIISYCDFNNFYLQTSSYLVRFFYWIPGLLKLDAYIKSANIEFVAKVNIFHLYFISLLLFYLIALFMKNHDNSILNVFIKMTGWSLFLYCLFANVPVVAYRFSQFIGIPVIFVIPVAFNFISNKIVLHKIFFEMHNRFHWVNKIINERILFYVMVYSYGIVRLLVLIYKVKLFNLEASCLLIYSFWLIV